MFVNFLMVATITIGKGINMNELIYIDEENAWNREMRSKDIGREVLLTMTYGEAKDLLDTQLKIYVSQIDKLQNEYKQRTSEYIKKTPEMDATIRHIHLRMAWLLAGKMKELDFALDRFEELRKYHYLNETRKQFTVNKDFDLTVAIETAKRIPIETLYGSNLKRAGSLMVDKCPIHEEKTPSFYVYPNNSWHCYGCSEGGDSISLYMKIHDCEFIDAVKQMNHI